MTYSTERSHDLRYESRSLTIVISILERGDSEEERKNVQNLIEKLDKLIRNSLIKIVNHSV